MVRTYTLGLNVVPYVGAWIETCLRQRAGLSNRSHPTWVRGLKHPLPDLMQPQRKSHPTWVRGLKLQPGSYLHHRGAVAPYVGAWIETSHRLKSV